MAQSQKGDLGPREAARELGIRLDAVYSLIWAGKLKAKKVDGKWWIDASSVAERLKRRRAAAVA